MEKIGLPPEKAKRRVDAIRESFAEALITGSEVLIPSMPNHEKDRHVLAATVRISAKPAFQGGTLKKQHD
jgi:hypothetical protein